MVPTITQFVLRNATTPWDASSKITSLGLEVFFQNSTYDQGSKLTKFKLGFSLRTYLHPPRGSSEDVIRTITGDIEAHPTLEILKEVQCIHDLTGASSAAWLSLIQETTLPKEPDAPWRRRAREDSEARLALHSKTLVRNDSSEDRLICFSVSSHLHSHARASRYTSLSECFFQSDFGGEACAMHGEYVCWRWSHLVCKKVDCGFNSI